MNRKSCIFVLLVVLFVASLFVGEETKSASVKQDDFSGFPDENGLDVYYFYGEGCPHCANVRSFLAEMELKYPLQIHKYDIYSNRSYISLFDEYSMKHGLLQSRRGVPAIFVANTYFVGDTPILDGLEEAVEKALQETPLDSSTRDSNQIHTLVEDNNGACDVQESSLDCMSFLTITVAALTDSISPCSIAILVFLIGARVLVANRRKRALKVGLAFCLSIFVAYFLFGMGLFTMVQVSGFSNIFSLLTGLVAILAGIFYLKDVFWYGRGGFTMEVPRSLKPLLMKMLKGVTSPFGAFVTGFVVVCFELPCTGGPYLFILGQMANSATRLQAIPLLLYYNFIFVLPLIVISLLLYSNFFSVGKVREWNEKNKAVLRLVGGFGMMALGFLVIPISQLLRFMQLFLLCFKVVGPFVLVLMLLYCFVSFRKRLIRLPGRGIFLLYLIVAPGFIAPSSFSLLVRPSSDVSGTEGWEGTDETSSLELLAENVLQAHTVEDGLGDDLKAVEVVEVDFGGGAHETKELCNDSADVQKGEGAGSLDSLIDYILDSGRLVLLYFYLDTCGWCKKQTPVVDELEEKYFEHVSIVRVNGKDEAEAAARFGVRGYPSMFLIRGKDEMGYVYELHRGFTEFDALEEAVAKTSYLHTTQKLGQENSEADEGGDACDNCIAVDNPEQESYDTNSLGESNYTIAAETTCSSCAACSEIIATGVYDRVTLTQDIIDHTGTCIIFQANDVVFDCANHLIDGDDSGTDYGIYLDEKTGNTIQNCMITDFRDGIYLYYSTLNTITGNTLNSNHNGIYLSSSTSNILSENTVNSQVWSGIALDYSSGNTISGNTVDSNNYHGIYLHNPPNNNNAIYNNIVTNNQRHGLYISSASSTNNRITSNRFCSNNQLGGDYYDIYDADSNPGDENTCDTTYNWDDAGTTGCTYACSMCIDNDEDGYGVCPNCGIANGCTYDGNDCDDTEPNINPGATEICNGVDDNCVNGIDEGGDELCDDGLWCNGAETCEGFSGCQAGTPVDCNDFNVCTVDYCDEASDTCVNTPVADGTPCDDHLFCTENTVCISGVCGDGNPKSCDDFNVCTTDYCNEELKRCENTPVADGTPTGNTCGVGACERAAVCIKGIETCTPGPPSPEICDGIDNDCDGVVDEGCGSDLVITDIWNENSFICYQIRNIGHEPAPEGHYTALFIDEDYRVSDVVTEELEPGERATRCFDYEWSCTPLEDLVEVWADYENDVPEDNETNNQRREIWRCDTTPPEIISGPIVQDVTQYSALIYWETNENSDSTVKYGKPARMYTSEETDPSLITSHSISLTGLEPSTTYHFKVLSSDISGNIVESNDVIFETLPLPDNVDPSVFIEGNETVQGIQLYSAKVSDNIGIEKVEFFINGTLLYTDFTPPYILTLDSHEFKNGKYELDSIVHDLSGRSSSDRINVDINNIKDYTYPTVSIIYPNEGDNVTGKVSIQAYLTDDVGLSSTCYYVSPLMLCRGRKEWNYPYPPAAWVNLEWDTTAWENDTYIIGVEVCDTNQPYPKCSIGTVSVNVENPPPPPPPKLKLTGHTVTRFQNYFIIKTSVKNIGGQNATNVRIIDFLDGFQPISSNETYTEFFASLEPHGDFSVMDIHYKLDIPPGQERIFTYHAVPILFYPSVETLFWPFSPNYRIGYMIELEWDSPESPFDIPEFSDTLYPSVLKTTGGETINEAHKNACKLADYLLITNPEHVFDQFIPSGVSTTWSSNWYKYSNEREILNIFSNMAKLARYKNGTLGYYFSNDAEVLGKLIEPNGAWGKKLSSKFSTVLGGYVLIVGETEIIPSFKIGGIVESDNPYSDTTGDAAPELIVGRIVGNSASDLRKALDNSLGVYEGLPGYGYDASDALLVSGTGKNEDHYKDRVNKYSGILTKKGVSTKVLHWQDMPNTPVWPGASYTIRDEAYFNESRNKDIILFRDHGNNDCWDSLCRGDLWGVDYNGTNPFIFALACTSGNYQGDDDNNLPEAILRSGAAVYISSTVKSGTGVNSLAGTNFFKTWNNTKDIGTSFTYLERNIMWQHHHSWVYKYNIYGDPKFGAVSTKSSTAQSRENLDCLGENLDYLEINIPDYEINSINGTDYVEIPGGQHLIIEGKPEVPTYLYTIEYSQGYKVQDVILISRSELVTDSGLNIPNALTGFDAPRENNHHNDNNEWFPSKEYDWQLLDNPNGTSTLFIVVYPFYYNSLTSDVRFYKNYSFEIDYSVSSAIMTRLETDKLRYTQGEHVEVDIEFEDVISESQDVIVSAYVKRYDSGEIIDGLLLRTLKNFSGLASFTPEWDTTGIEPGYYYVEVNLVDTTGNVLDRKTEMFRLGISSGEIIDFTVVPEIFDVGDDIEINMTFNNTGTVNITGVATIRIFDSNGSVVEQFLHDIISLMPSESVVFTDTWNTINASEISYYHILGYVSYDSTTTDPVKALIQTDYDGDGVGDAEDNCRYVENPDQNDTNSNCPLPPYTEDPKCGDACEVVECPGDINGDLKVDHEDLLLLAGAYGSEVGDPNYIPEADLNNDGRIDHVDLLILAANYGKTCYECPGDINGDSKVDHKDLLLLAGAYGSQAGDPKYDPDADLNNDGNVNHKDLLILAANYGRTCYEFSGDINGDLKVDRKDLLSLAGAHAYMHASVTSPLIIFASVITLATATSAVNVKHRKKQRS